MKRIFLLIPILFLAASTMAATVIVKISQFPNTTSPANSDLFLLASGATNKNITWNQLKDAIGTNPATVTILNNLYVSNLFTTNIYSSNIYTTNMNVVNEFRGKTTFIENNYSTNLYTVFPTTNYYLFSTNLYITNLVNDYYVSNYFQTNVFADTYISNFFTTNQYNYLTNIYSFSTNLTVTNFYAGDTYVSNFFNTNIFVNDTYVSNFFTTNLYNTINITTNITYQMGAPLTNASMYGWTMLLGYENNPYPGLYIDSPDGYPIALDGKTGNINASGFLGDSFYQLEWTWDGPTNVVDTWTSDQYYTATTDCEITGIDDQTRIGYGWSGLLTITNAAATNITLRFPATIRIPERTTSVTISNTSQGMLSLKYSKQSGTNGVYRQF